MNEILPHCTTSFPCCLLKPLTSHHFAFFASQQSTLFLACLYQKDLRAYWGTLPSVNVLLYSKECVASFPIPKKFVAVFFDHVFKLI
jgi:hypothetical protein